MGVFTPGVNPYKAAVKFIFRWLFRIFIVLLILAIAAVLLLDTIVKEVIIYRVHHKSGLDVKIGKMNVGLIIPQVGVENAVIYNTSGSPLLDLPELHIEYDRDALSSNEIHCTLVRFNLAGLNIQEDKNGMLNLDTLQKGLEAAFEPSEAKKKKGIRFKFTGIDRFNLTLAGKATFTSAKNPSRNLELKLDTRNTVFTNVTANDLRLSAVIVVILLKNGVNIIGNDPNSNWSYWLDRLRQPSPK